MKKLPVLVGLLSLLFLSPSASSAHGPTGSTCAGGPIAAGVYNGLTVTGNCWFSGASTDTLLVHGNLVVDPGAVLNDHAGSPDGSSQPGHVTITGNAIVRRGAILGLGTYNPFAVHDVTVGGSVLADRPLSLYLSFITVRGSLISQGGGGGTTGEFRNFPTKDDTIGGDLVIAGWTGGWIGILRDHVGGNVVFSHNRSVLNFDDTTGTSIPGPDPDSSEVATNVIGGNLTCWANTPPAQIGDSGGLPNVVGGRKLGECAHL